MPEAIYQPRLDRLRATKLAQTQAKKAVRGHIDADDHGMVLPPADFQWRPVANHANGGFYGMAGWGANFRSLMEAHPTYVDADDALAGRYMAYLQSHYRGWNPDFPHVELEAEQRRYGIVSGIGAPHHFCPDFQIGLELGWDGLLAKLRHWRTVNAPAGEAYYDASEQVILGVQNWIGRHLPAIEAAAARETLPERQANLAEMLAVNTWVQHQPPRSLREACQWLAWYNAASRVYNGDGAGGWLDQLLWPYYRRDLEAGRIDEETAIYYLACLLLNDPQYYQLGGPLADGNDATNRLSFLILEAAHRLRIACNLTIRVHDRLDRRLFDLGVRYLFEDRLGYPRFCGDKGLTEGFARNGYPLELGRQRVAVGCHWMAIPGREYTLNDCVKINCGKVFEAAFLEMMASSPTPSVANLWERFVAHLERAVVCTARGLDFHLAHQKDNEPELMISLLCHGTLEKGRDACDGGVEYYHLCVDGSALATVADSFAALEQRLERENALSWAALERHLADNYAGPEGERVRLMLRGSERYGAGQGLGDAWAVRISQTFSQLVVERPTPGGRRMLPGWFSWSNTIGMGKELMATPNGRHAGAPISHGANPDPGFRKDGAPTAMVRAIAAIQPGYGNTAPIQMELDPGLSRDAGGLDRVASLIHTHFDLGGTLFNINILDRDKLLAAHRNPELYPDLVVRVTGFTAYFAILSPAFRQLVVERLLAE